MATRSENVTKIINWIKGVNSKFNNLSAEDIQFDNNGTESALPTKPTTIQETILALLDNYANYLQLNTDTHSIYVDEDENGNKIEVLDLIDEYGVANGSIAFDSVNSKLLIEIGNEDNVNTIEITPTTFKINDIDIATTSDIEKHNKDITSHTDIRNTISQLKELVNKYLGDGSTIPTYEEISIAKSDNYNVASDTELPTTKAVNTIINNEITKDIKAHNEDTNSHTDIRNVVNQLKEVVDEYLGDGSTIPTYEEVNIAKSDNYDTTSDTELPTSKAVKAIVDAVANNKVDKVEGKSLILDTEIARLANVNNYDDSEIKASIENEISRATTKEANIESTLGNNAREITTLKTQLAQANTIIHETVAQTVEEDYCFNSMITPSNVSIGETSYPIIDGTYAQINSLSGRSLKSKNILNIKYNTSSYFAINEDNTMTFVQKPTSRNIWLAGSYYNFSNKLIDKCLLTLEKGTYTVSGGGHFFFILEDLTTKEYEKTTFTLTQNAYLMAINLSADWESFDVGTTIYNMLVEGTTPPTTYQPYWDGIKNATINGVKTFDVDSNKIGSISIPAEIQALDGYGWGLSNSDKSLNNYIDFERKVFVQNVGKYTFTGNENWSYYSPLNRYQCVLSNTQFGKHCTDGSVPLIIEGYTAVSWSRRGSLKNLECCESFDSNNSIFVRHDGILTVEEMVLSMIGKSVYYQLAQPIETDISQYLTEDIIKIYQGGTISLQSNDTYPMECLTTLALEVKYWKES